MPQQEQLLVREAAAWFARMHGPDAAHNNPEFQAWLAENETHRDAYSRVSEAFSLGKNLPKNAMARSNAQAATRKAHRRKLIAAGLAMVVAFGGISLAVERFGFAPVSRPAVVVATDHFAADTGTIRTVRLSDGSTIILDTGSEVQVHFGADRRDIWLLHGRARFDVAHEARPFVVHAGGGTVTAHGTVFDVRVEHGTASVRLLRGAIDVNIPQHGDAPSETRRVAPGEAVSFEANRGIATILSERGASIDQPSWPSGLLEFNRARVADVIAEANRYSSGHAITAAPDIADMRVSGTFRVADADRLAQDLAILLDIHVQHQSNADIVLSASPS